MVIVGDIEISEVTKHFDIWEKYTSHETEKLSIVKAQSQIILIDKKDAAQSEIRMGHFSRGRNSEDFYARSVLNSILGGQFSSRINLNLREDKGYTYGAHSNYNYNQLGSTFSVSTSVKSENTIDAIKEILFELKNIKTTITKEEVDFAKSFLVRRYPSLFETYSQIAANLTLLPIHKLGADYFENYIGKINKTDLHGVSQAAEENIYLDNLVIVVVGNAKIIGESLKDLADKTSVMFNLIS